MPSRTSASLTLRPMRSASRSRILSVIALSSARIGICSCLARSGVYWSANCRRYWLSSIWREHWYSAREMVAPPTWPYQETLSLVPPSPAPKSAKMKSTNRAMITHRIQLKYFTFSRRTLSIQRLLSLRAARRRREQHFTSRRPGRTTRLPCDIFTNPNKTDRKGILVACDACAARPQADPHAQGLVQHLGRHPARLARPAAGRRGPGRCLHGLPVVGAPVARAQFPADDRRRPAAAGAGARRREGGRVQERVRSRDAEPPGSPRRLRPAALPRRPGERSHLQQAPAVDPRHRRAHHLRRPGPVHLGP